LPYHNEDLRREIRRLRNLFYGHQKIIETLKIPERTYYYHWDIIKQENKRIYDKLTEDNIREDIERTIAGIEQKIAELQQIIDKPESQQDKIKAISTQAELMTAIPRIRQEGGEFINELGDIKQEQQRANTQQTQTSH